MKLDDRIMEVIEAVPMISAREIVTLLTDAKISSVTARLVTLFAEGRVIRERNSGNSGVYLYTAAPAGTKPPQKTVALRAPTNAAIAHKASEIESECAELREWKADAIRRFPELAVPEIIMRARAIVSDALKNEGDSAPVRQGLAEIASGKRDHTVAVRAVVAALELVQ